MATLESVTPSPEGPNNVPGYVTLASRGELNDRAAMARDYLRECVLCARHCKVDRLRTLRGAACRTGPRAVVHSFGAHHGEEVVLRGWGGSGTVFFGWCNLRCLFCQNWEISQKGSGREVEADELAGMMLDLQETGCHNINLVSPSHVVAQFLEALSIAADRGLRLPLVYNSGGYDSPEALELLDGVVDIYMPDMKYGASREARHYSRIRNYTSVNRKAIKEMHRQVGDLVVDDRGLARRGLLVRHLVLPGGLANTGQVFKFISEEISPDTYVNLMDQYRPCYRAVDHTPLNRRLEDAEYKRALTLAEKYGLHRLEGFVHQVVESPLPAG